MENANTCEDFLAFQETLKAMRKIDDNIIHALNTTIPTNSFVENFSQVGQQCQQLHQQLMDAYERREKAIKTCISESSTRVNALKGIQLQNDNDLVTLKQLRKQQKRLRLLQNELNVEEVVKDRSLKAFHERCRLFYKHS